jgi:hypothetical protein
MLRSPAPSATTCSKTSAPLHKPLPSRPRSLSLPSTPEPVELPGSLLLQNEGYLSPSPVAGSTPSTMRSARSGNPIRSSTSARSIPPHVPQRRLLDEAGLKRRSRSRPNLLTTQSAESTVTKCSLSTENGDQTSSASSSRARVGAEQLLPLVVDGKASRRSSGGSSVHAVEVGTFRSFRFPGLSGRQLSRAARRTCFIPCVHVPRAYLCYSRRPRSPNGSNEETLQFHTSLRTRKPACD